MNNELKEPVLSYFLVGHVALRAHEEKSNCSSGINAFAERGLTSLSGPVVVEPPVLHLRWLTWLQLVRFTFG